MVFLGVWIILGVSGRCLGEFRCHINHKQLNRSRHIKLLPFLPVTSHSQNVLNFGVSVRCLEGVWKVSAGCLGDSGYCLVYWLSKKIIFGHNTQILHCSSSDLWCVKRLCVGVSGGVWGCLGGVWGCLDGVWGSLDIVWEVETQNQLKTIQWPLF